MEKEKAKAKNNAGENSLEAAIGFTSTDLEANQDGQLSSAQVAKLRDQRHSIRVTAVIAILTIPFVVLVGILNDTGGDLFLILIVLMFLAGFGALSYLRDGRLMFDIRENSANAVQGYVSLHMNKGYYITISNKTWQVNEPVFLAFKNGDPYCLYYAPHSRTLLSAEWLREA